MATVTIQLSNGGETLIDEEDYELISKYRWRADRMRQKTARPFVYARAYHSSTYANGKQRNRDIYMHRWIMGEPEGKMIDHINGDTLDNRRQNLAVVDRTANCRNHHWKREVMRLRALLEEHGIAH